jgi:diguanylate cyclase (GGDEF)-like protein
LNPLKKYDTKNKKTRRNLEKISMSTQRVKLENLLSKIAKSIRNRLELQEILTIAVDKIYTILKVEQVIIEQCTIESHRVVVALARGRSAHHQTRERFLYPQAEHPQAAPDRERLSTHPIAHLRSLALPLVLPEGLWGWLTIQPAPEIAMTEQRTLQQIADSLTIAIAQSQLQMQTQKQTDRNAMLQQIGDRLHTQLWGEPLALTLLAQIADALQGMGSRLYIAPSSVQREPQIYIYGSQPNDLHPEESDQQLYSPVRWHNASLGEFFPVEIVNRHSDDRSHSLTAAAISLPIQSRAIVALQYRDRCIGYLSVFRSDPAPAAPDWHPDEIQWLKSVAMQFYLALEYQQTQTLLKSQSDRDALTGLFDRHGFEQQLEHVLGEFNPDRNQTLAVAFLDIDRFKMVNYTLGHECGDRFLVEVAQRVQACLLPAYDVARWYGARFALLCPNLTQPEDLLEIVQAILNTLSQPFDLNDREIYVTVSIGISALSSPGGDAQTLLQQAEIALYQVKQQGKHRYRFYTAQMEQAALDRLLLESDLRQALCEQQFCLYYQPQIEIETGRVLGMEALVRWQHPRRGLLYPDEFIPVAEEAGLIHALGEWVLQAACLQHQAWVRDGLPAVRMGVNLSALQFQQPDLVPTIAKILHDTHMDPRYLEIEITESTVVDNLQQAIAILRELQQMGVAIAMDDFGTGYSCLSSIKHFPLSTLKLDRSFVQELAHNDSDAAIAKTVLALGHGLNLIVLAEGVENDAQLAFLQSINCDLVQGYLFSPALPPGEAMLLLERG